MNKAANILIGAGTAMTGASFFLNTFFFTVDAGQRAVMFDRAFGGVKNQIYGEGMHFKIPFAQSPIHYEVRLKPKTITSMTGTRDLQTVDIGVRLLHRPLMEELPWIYNNIGINYDEKILPSIGNEVLKSVVAQYDADQLLKQREAISLQIKEQLIKRAKDFNILLDDVAIVHLSFMKEYAAAIENKQVAQQMAERQKFVVLRSEQQKLAAIIEAEGKAEAAQLINQSVIKNGNSLIEIRRLEAAEAIATSLAKNSNVAYLPGGNTANLLNLRV